MRLMVVLCLLRASMALMEALPSEIDAWYKAYLIERMTPGLESGQRVIGAGCQHKPAVPFDAKLVEFRLPKNTCSYLEFAACVATGQWRKRILSTVTEWEYSARDFLTKLQGMTDDRNIEGTFNVEASEIYNDASFQMPREHQRGWPFALDKLQRIIAMRVEQCRTLAALSGDSEAIAQIERWVVDRISALKVANAFRVSDQLRFLYPWIAENTKFQKDGNKLPKEKLPLLFTSTPIRYADGQEPTVGTSIRDKKLNPYDKPEWESSFGKSGRAKKVEADTIRIMKEYWATPPTGSEDEALKMRYAHTSIIIQNDADISRHSGKPSASCKKSRREVSLSRLLGSRMDQLPSKRAATA